MRQSERNTRTRCVRGAALLGALLSGFVASVSLNGCATTMTSTAGVFERYAGAKLDAFVVQSKASGTSERIFATLDFPFSFVADTALLVATVPLDPTGEASRAGSP